MIPFLFLYLPLIRNGHGRSYDEVLSFALLPRDFFNIGPNNLVWSEFVKEFNIVPMNRLYNLEINNVMTPTLLICALVFSIFTIKNSKIYSYLKFIKEFRYNNNRKYLLIIDEVHNILSANGIIYNSNTSTPPYGTKAAPTSALESPPHPPPPPLNPSPPFPALILDLPNTSLKKG
jgi:hypothetical protein